jgi:hypothetical protein
VQATISVQAIHVGERVFRIDGISNLIKWFSLDLQNAKRPDTVRVLGALDQISIRGISSATIREELAGAVCRYLAFQIYRLTEVGADDIQGDLASPLVGEVLANLADLSVRIHGKTYRPNSYSRIDRADFEMWCRELTG